MIPLIVLMISYCFALAGMIWILASIYTWLRYRRRAWFKPCVLWSAVLVGTQLVVGLIADVDVSVTAPVAFWTTVTLFVGYRLVQRWHRHRPA
jgi:predicted tellurium resistance membrane protein TerC